jgi:hypothetical protein
LLWGIRRYAALVLAMVLALGVLVPVLLSRRTEVYQATAQIGPTDKLELSNADPLPRIAESVFNNGAVEDSIRKLLHKDTGNIIPSRVRLIAAQDNLVLEVVARAPTAGQAMDIANQAASTFVVELNLYSKSVAEFSLTHKAILAKKVPKLAGGYASVALGLIGGLLAGVALVGLLMVMRRPIVDVSTAQDVTGAPALGRISLSRHHPPNVSDGRAIGLLCRRLLKTSAATIHVAAPTHAQAEQLAGSMKEVFGRMRADRQQKGSAGQSNLPRLPRVFAPEGAEAWIGTPDDKAYTLLLVPEGISTRKLRLLAEGHDTGAPRGVVLVTTRRTWSMRSAKG